MKLYMALDVPEWEGCSILGIYDTREKAQIALDSCEVFGDKAIEELILNEQTRLF